jgi:tRNA (cytidine/uridine-2'-O-)-methyltransferase
MRLALFQPDIPQNTGAIMRLCACLGVTLDIIGPAGFDFSDRALKRAALDYWPHVNVMRHESFAAFEDWRSRAEARLLLLTTRGETPYLAFRFKTHDILVLGRESAGAPDYVHEAADARLRVPMREGLRSMNIAVAAALVLGEAMRQTGAFDGLA